MNKLQKDSRCSIIINEAGNPDGFPKPQLIVMVGVLRAVILLVDVVFEGFEDIKVLLERGRR